MPTPAVNSTIKFTDVTTEFTLSVNPPSRAIGADFRFAGGAYTPASPAIPTGATATISLSGDLGGRTKAGGPAPLYSFDNFFFTSSNVTGQTGPNLANFISPPVPFSNPAGPANTSPAIPPGFNSRVSAEPWFGSYWSLYLSRPGYQQWTVPETATYAVIAAGAPGAVWAYVTSNNVKYANNGGKSSGKGAVLAGPFNFTRGQKLIITIGQTARELYLVANPGNNIFTIPGRGGGGCTAIVDAANTSVPILVAGGGGGTCCTNGTVGYNNGQGTKSFYIHKSAIASAAGTDGGGGDNCAGAGFGANSGNATAAQSWANGFAGGSNGYATNPSVGGFGGGGAGGLQVGVQTKGGGGGGYIGGNGAGGQPLVTTTQNNSGGFGGTSYCTVSTNAAVTPIYGVFYGEGNGGGNSQPSNGAIPAGYCWIKKVTPLVTNFTITFTDMGGYAYNPYIPDGINYSNLGNAQLPVLYTTNSLGFANFQAWLTAAIASNAAFNYTCPNWYAFQPGLVAWVVPNTGNYMISAAGGGGDYSYDSSAGGARNPGGRGRLIAATYSLNIGDVLIMAVGQRGYGGGNSNSAGASADLGYGGAGGATMVMRNGLISADNTLSATLPGFPLIYAAAGSGGSSVFAGTDASSTDLTGTTPTPGTTTVGPGGGVAISAGACFLNAPSGRCNALFSATGFILNSAYVVGAGGSFGGGWPGGGRGSTTTTLAGGGAGWNGALGSSATVPCGAATSYYWTGSGYVAASYTGGYNSAVISGSGSTGTGYVTIQQL